jgi:hypothetical protein
MEEAILSLLLGFVVGYVLFLLTYKKIIFRGPNSNIIRRQIYKKNGQCYKLTPFVVKCDNFS